VCTYKFIDNHFRPETRTEVCKDLWTQHNQHRTGSIHETRVLSLHEDAAVAVGSRLDVVVVINAISIWRKQHEMTWAYLIFLSVTVTGMTLSPVPCNRNPECNPQFRPIPLASARPRRMQTETEG
jgi:hypothetical protein